MRHALQPKSDDYQCGIWCHVVLECLVKYLESAEAPSSAGFDLFVHCCAAARLPPDPVNDNSASSTGYSFDVRAMYTPIKKTEKALRTGPKKRCKDE